MTSLTDKEGQVENFLFTKEDFLYSILIWKFLDNFQVTKLNKKVGEL
jgi:hypothetical protein